MDEKKFIAEAKEAALDVLLKNSKGPYRGLPRTAGDGYPEPYTRDLMICALGICKTKNELLLASLREVLKTLARHQSRKGLIPSLVHDAGDTGASDTTPLFLMALGAYRKTVKEPGFLKEAADKALLWLSYQSPDDCIMISQQPTSDWRDEEWVLGYPLFSNAVYYGVLKQFGKRKDAAMLYSLMNRFDILGGVRHRHTHEGLKVRNKPYYAEWAYKVMASERFDLLGNSIAILSGLAPKTRAGKIIEWVEEECGHLKKQKELAIDLPPVLFPYIRKGDPDWHRRYEEFNNPGHYHNGGIWPFVSGFYVAAVAKTGKMELAKKKLLALAKLNKISRNPKYEWGFPEWFKAQDGTPQGASHQSWSAGMFLYAAGCVEGKR
jgi:hypothetical protein